MQLKSATRITQALAALPAIDLMADLVAPDVEETTSSNPVVSGEAKRVSAPSS